MLKSENDFFESDEYIFDDEEDCPILGGDQDNDPPLEKYLPELKKPETKREIIQNEELRLY